MPFKSTIRIPSEVLDAIVSLTELTTAFAVQSAMEAGRHDAYGDPQRAEASLAELAKGADAATGEVAWLVEELDTADLDRDQRADAAIAIAGLQQTMVSAASAVQETGAFDETAVALRRSAEYLDGPLAAVRP
ncbi:hypothetical protein OJ997_17325 [Solirubrobacter phytolaccae]|uniref:Uncharacterized protein n=1 Tax=Solirubrobacter phytolaccae TaxID=1404360 RepID=A0A9X3NBZ6_9ACTN|nr:hypothetical protein [Solirubrobacter phytolaccae]MDA0182070.1 hypothetical protein [Solirubrobacter phytolaccae]